MPQLEPEPELEPQPELEQPEPQPEPQPQPEPEPEPEPEQEPEQQSLLTPEVEEGVPCSIVELIFSGTFHEVESTAEIFDDIKSVVCDQLTILMDNV
eukprot:COSAG03_NODE_18614_length_351_cov_1.230159_1_plen_96_part_01